MCWQCDHPGATAADYFEELRETIRKRKWACNTSKATGSHTRTRSGCTTRTFPSYSMTGVSPERAMRLLNAVAKYTVREVQPAPGDLMAW